MTPPLLQLPIARLTRAPRAWIPIAVWSLLAFGAAMALHRARPAESASDALQSVFGALALPLLAYAVVGATLGGDGLARSVRSLTALGAPAAGAALAEVVVAVLASALLAAVVGVVVALLGHGPADPPLVRDALATAWIGALGGAAYAALFSLGASFGKRGGGRALFLVLDWAIGASTDAIGLATPRAHVRSLLGGEAVDALSNRASTVILVALTILFGALAVRRARTSSSSERVTSPSARLS